jgi:hypothetical protein
MVGHIAPSIEMGADEVTLARPSTRPLCWKRASAWHGGDTQVLHGPAARAEVEHQAVRPMRLVHPSPGALVLSGVWVITAYESRRTIHSDNCSTRILALGGRQGNHGCASCRASSLRKLFDQCQLFSQHARAPIGSALYRRNQCSCPLSRVCTLEILRESEVGEVLVRTVILVTQVFRLLTS